MTFASSSEQQTPFYNTRGRKDECYRFLYIYIIEKQDEETQAQR